MTRVLCAGDRFIGADLLATAAADALGSQTLAVRYETRWPDDPFGPVEGVQEASGDPSELARLAVDADVILTHLAPVTRSVLEAAERLGVVGVTRGGPVNVDLEAATEFGIPVLYLPGRNLSAVAEFTVGLLVDLPRNITTAARTLAGGTWDARYYRYGLTGPELGASVLGLVGLGAVGLRVASIARAFGARVLAADPYADPEPAREAGVELVTLDDLLARSDFVSVHARLTEETRRMFGRRAFAAMKPGAYFVNTARGALVDQAALLEALESGRLAGAALDVFDPEPPDPDDPLLRRFDVIVTPHVAGASRQVATLSARRIAETVASFLDSGRPEHCANPAWEAAVGPR